MTKVARKRPKLTLRSGAPRGTRATPSVPAPAVQRGAPAPAAEAPAVSDLRGAFDNYHATMLDLRSRMDEVAEVVDNQGAVLDQLSGQTAAARMGTGTGIGDFSNRALSEAQTRFRAFLSRGEGAVDFDSRSLSTDSLPDGGFVVPTIIDAQLGRLLADVNPFRRLARIATPQTGNYAKVIMLGGSAASWTTERATPMETAGPSFAEIEPPIGELYAMPKITQRLIDDAGIDIVAEVMGDIAKAFGEKEGAAFVSGDGNNKPRGFLTYTKSNQVDGVRAYGALQYVASGHASGFLTLDLEAGTSPVDVLYDIVYATKPGYLPNAVWMMNRKTAARIRKWRDLEGRPVWSDGITAAQPPTLLGFPVVLCEDMPDVAADQYPIAFGDFSKGYVIVDPVTSRFRMLRDPYTSKPFVNIYTTQRVGGGVEDSQAIKLLKVATS